MYILIYPKRRMSKIQYSNAMRQRKRHARVVMENCKLYNRYI